MGKVDRIDLAGLALHERAVARDLEILGVPAANWPAKIEDAAGQPVLDVLVVGAGMNGIAAAAPPAAMPALRKEAESYDVGVNDIQAGGDVASKSVKQKAFDSLRAPVSGW